jgi:hypothetical protein
MRIADATARSVLIGVTKRTSTSGDTVDLAPALGRIGRSLAALGILAMAGPAGVQAQVGLASGAAQIALIARVSPRASISGISSSEATARRGTWREGSVKVRLSANTGYRLMAVGTGPVSSTAEPASRLWVRAENGRFEEVRSGVAVTVVRGRHTVGEWEPEVNFRSEASESVDGPQVLPVRYEVRIDPVI